MKIQVIKQAEKKTTPSSCAFFVEGLLEPRK